jgi:hypothetical protein
VPGAESYLMTFRCWGNFAQRPPVLSPLPTVAPSTNHISNASNSVEGEANTPNPQFSMVMSDVDN